MSMTATLIIALATTGVSLAGLMIGLVAWLRADMRRMEDRLLVMKQSLWKAVLRIGW